MITSPSFPSVAQLSTQCFLRANAPDQPTVDTTQFAERTRGLNHRLTDRAAMVLLAALKCPGITVKDCEAAIQVKHGTIYAVLRGLHDLGLIEVSGGNYSWTKTVSPTAAGIELASEALRYITTHQTPVPGESHGQR